MENETVRGESSIYEHVNFEHALLKFYVLVERYHPSSMPSCLTATTFLFFTPHKRNYYECTIIKNQVLIPPMLNSPVILRGVIWVKRITPC